MPSRPHLVGNPCQVQSKSDHHALSHSQRRFFYSGGHGIRRAMSSSMADPAKKVEVNAFYTVLPPFPWEIDPSLTEEKAKELEISLDEIQFDSILSIDAITPQ